MFLAEMKKIWKPQTVLLIAAFSVLFFYSFMYQWMKPFSYDGDSLNVQIDILSTWIARYGNTIERTEFDEIEDCYDGILYQARAVIVEEEYFKENGVYSYEDYLGYGQKAVNGYDGYDYGVYSDMRNLILQNTGLSSIYFQEYESAMQKYRISGDARSSILPPEVLAYTDNYMVNLAVLCLICVFFVSAPVMVNDRENGITDAQYSCKAGRKIYKLQYACTMLSSFTVVSLVIIIVMSAWKMTGTSVFVKSGLSSFLSTEKYVIPITYEKYIMLFIIMAYLLALGIGGIIFCLSANSSNTISMLLKAIPALTVGILTSLLFRNAFCESNMLYRLFGGKYCGMIAAAAVLGAGVLLNAGNYRVVCKRG